MPFYALLYICCLLFSNIIVESLDLVLFLNRIILFSRGGQNWGLNSGLCAGALSLEPHLQP
jgi:hypothetical protein